MSSRKPMSKKTRFEVFKRDSFTCQYCGNKAPDVVLHCDHIRPVADGGTNDILNLVTACVDCNGGKGARKLDDRSAVERQRSQIEELAERREQLEMMLAWRDSLQAETIDTVEEIAKRIAERGGWGPNEAGRNDIRRWLKRFSASEILYALDESFDHYMRFVGDEPDQKAWEVAFGKIPAIASLRKQSVEKPYIQRLAYIQGILRRRLREPHSNFIDLLEQAVLKFGHTVEDLERAAKVADSWDAFVEISARFLCEKLMRGDDE